MATPARRCAPLLGGMGLMMARLAVPAAAVVMERIPNDRDPVLGVLDPGGDRAAVARSTVGTMALGQQRRYHSVDSAAGYRSIWVRSA